MLPLLVSSGGVTSGSDVGVASGVDVACVVPCVGVIVAPALGEDPGILGAVKLGMLELEKSSSC
mgnify:CR=1 FL=1